MFSRMPRTHDRRRSIARFARAVALALAAAGCSGAKHESPGAPPSVRAARDGYMREYELGRYPSAYEQASQAAATDEGAARDQAALIAGLSAQALKRESDARRWLAPLTTNSDREIAGRASAGLGLLEQEKGNHARAAELLASAGSRLDGDDGARAAYHAGESMGAIGQANSARLQYEASLAKVTDPRLRTQIQRRLDKVKPGGFTVQLGAFSSRANAEKSVRSAAATAARLNLGQPTISERPGVRGTVYVVQVGRFATRDQAAQARTSFGGATVTPVFAPSPGSAGPRSVIDATPSTSSGAPPRQGPTLDSALTVR